LPLFSLRFLVSRQYITSEQAAILSQVRLHNPLLFTFVLTRHLQFQGKRFDSSVFHTRLQWMGGINNAIRI